MLKHEITKQENAVEEYICKQFESAEKHEMDKETTADLLRLMLVKKGNLEIPEKEKPFLIKVIESRVRACFTYKMEDIRLVLFLAMLTETPGSAVMYLTYLQYWCKKNNCHEIDLDKFCQIFPIGFPSKEDLHKIWDGQKIERAKGSSISSDNLLDHQSAMVSIQFPVTA